MWPAECWAAQGGVLSDYADTGDCTGDGVTQVTMLSATGGDVVVLCCCGGNLAESCCAAAGAGGHNPVPALCSGQQQALVLSRDHGLEWCTPSTQHTLSAATVCHLWHQQEWLLTALVVS